MRTVVLLTLLALALGSLVDQRASLGRYVTAHAAQRNGHVVASRLMADSAYTSLTAPADCTAAGFDAVLANFVSTLNQFQTADNQTQINNLIMGMSTFFSSAAAADCFGLAASMFEMGPVQITVADTRACVREEDDPLLANDPCCTFSNPPKCCLPRTITKTVQGGLKGMKTAVVQQKCIRPAFISAMWPAIYRYTMRAESTCTKPLQHATASMVTLITTLIPCFLEVLNPFKSCNVPSDCLSNVCASIGSQKFCRLPPPALRPTALATCIVSSITDVEAVYTLRVSVGVNYDASDADLAAKIATEISSTICLDPTTNQPASPTDQASCEAVKFCAHNPAGIAAGPGVTNGQCTGNLASSGGNFCALAMPLGLGFYNLGVALQANCPVGICFSNGATNTKTACESGSFCSTSTSITDATTCAGTGYCRGNWPLNTKTLCETSKYCDGEIGVVNQDMAADECARCGGNMVNKYTWVPGTMVSGVWADTTWTTTSAVQKYLWGVNLDFEKFSLWVNKMMIKFISDVFKSVFSCAYMPLFRGIQETAHACTTDGKAAYPNAPKDVSFAVAKALFYKGLSKKAAAGPGTSIAIAKDGVNAANGQVSVELSVTTGGDVGTATGRRLLQSGGNVYNKAGTSVVGQTVGNGIAVTMSGGSATYRLCLEVDPSVSTPGRTSPGIAMSDSNGKINNQEIATTVEGGKYCGTLSAAGTYYPIRTGAGSGAAFLMPSLLVIFLAFFML